MKTWILVAASSSAAIFFFDPTTQALHLTRNFRARGSFDHFVRYISEELEIACSVGTDADLVLWGEAPVLKRLSTYLSGRVQTTLLRKKVLTHVEQPNHFPQELKPLLVAQNA